MRYRLLFGIGVDDLLKDWNRYCALRGMRLGVLPDAATQTVTVLAEDRECSLHIACADGPDADGTLVRYLGDWRRRHPETDLWDLPDEAELRLRCRGEEYVGFIVG